LGSRPGRMRGDPKPVSHGNKYRAARIRFKNGAARRVPAA
jgi:hypothetical protein